MSGRQLTFTALVTVVVVAFGSVLLATGLPVVGSDGEVVFSDVGRQSREFMGYESSIRLTADQEAIKREALTAIPAPCCSDNSALTCCCPCNMARTIWGLSHFLIVEQAADAAAVKAKVQEWIEFINPGGFSGDACYTGGCGKPFNKGGCGGMNPASLVL